MKKPDRDAEGIQVSYTDHFGMVEKPFGLTPDPDFFFESRSHAEALHRLESFVKEGKGLALVYGDVGTGKTLVSRRLLNDFDRLGYRTALIINPFMDERELLLDIAGQFGISPPPFSTHESLSAALADFVLDEKKKGKTCVLAVDEAQLLSEDALAVLTELSCRGTDDAAGLRTVLFGQEEIATRLLNKGLEQLRRNITVTHYLQPLSGDEVGRYVKYRLSKSGSNGSISFTEDALGRIYAISRGYPRVVNGICDQSLLLLSRGSKHVVGRQVLNRVLKNEFLPPSTGWCHGKLSGRVLYRVALILAAVLVFCGLLLYLRPVLGLG